MSLSAPDVDLPGRDDTRAAGLIASATLLWVLAAGFVALRCYIRTRIAKVFGADDWTLLVALFFSLGDSIGMVVLTTFGYGKHTWWITPENGVNIAKLSFAFQVCYMLSLATTKISILILYLRILTYHHARWITWAILVLTIVYNIVGFAVQMTTCVPLQKLWEPNLYGTCHSLALAWAFVGLHVSTDFIIFALPIPIVATIIMSPRQKILLVVLFSLGFFACAVSLIRTIYVKTVFESTVDPSWDSIDVSHWNTVEVNVAIVCACIMTMKPLIAKVWPQLLDLPTSDDDGDPASASARESASSVRENGNLSPDRSRSAYYAMRSKASGLGV